MYSIKEPNENLLCGNLVEILGRGLDFTTYPRYLRQWIASNA